MYKKLITLNKYRNNFVLKKISIYLDICAYISKIYIKHSSKIKEYFNECFPAIIITKNYDKVIAFSRNPLI